MASMKKWFGFATIGAALAGLVARMRNQREPEAETGPSAGGESLTEAGEET